MRARLDALEVEAAAAVAVVRDHERDHARWDRRLRENDPAGAIARVEEADADGCVGRADRPGRRGLRGRGWGGGGGRDRGYDRKDALHAWRCLAGTRREDGVPGPL